MRKNRVLLFIIASILGLAIVTGFIALQSSPPPPLMTASPNPTGYLRMAQAGDLIQKQTSEFSKMDQNDLRTLVDANSNVLQTARSGFSEKIQVPVEYSDSYVGNHLPDLARLKSLALAFEAEGKLAEMELRPCDATRSYLDAVRLGIECRRGGLLIDALVGIAVESIGTTSLQTLITNLDGKCCREVAHELETLNAQKQSWDDTLQQERYWSHRTFPGLQYRLIELFTSNWKSALAKGEQHFKTEQTKTCRLLIALAARAYKLENGHRPKNVSDLTPTYLSVIPRDPSTGTNLSYLP